MDTASHHRLLVVELDDQAGPRRRADRPNLYVGTTSGDPQERFRQIRTSSKRHPLVREQGVKVRNDLVRSYRPTAANDVRRQKRKLVHKLQRQGYTVNGDTRVWHVYVVELDAMVGTSLHPDKPWVYVGETSIPVEERFQQHITGARNRRGPLFSRFVHGHAVRLRPDLYQDETPCFTAEDAKVAEAALAARLLAEGYSVKGGH